MVGKGNQQRFVPPTPRAHEKFGEPDEASDVAKCQGGSVHSARGLTRWAIGQLLEVMPDLSEAVRRKLSCTSPHALRHTVGTQMLAAGVALGHAQPNRGKTRGDPGEGREVRSGAEETFGERETYGISANVTFEVTGYDAYPAR